MRIKLLPYFVPAILLPLLVVGILLIKQRQPTYSQVLCKDCNVILITMTNLRYDHMSSNGYFRPTTPNLDKLAKESIVFDNAFSHASWTLPESISMYTSLYPFQHGVMNRYDGGKLSQETPTILELLKRAGYTTAAFTGGFDYKVDYGLTSRFDEFDQCQEGTESLPARVSLRHIGPKIFGEFECTIPKALNWLKSNFSKKFFLHVQGFDAHCPFSQRGGFLYDQNYLSKIDFSYCLRTLEATKPRIIDGKTYWPVVSDQGGINEVLLGERDMAHLVAIYDEAITNSDKEISRLIEEIKNKGLWEKTIIIFTSEHGDMFGEHGRFMRGGALHDTFYDGVLHIPLVIKHPKIPAKRVTGLVGQIDLAPTILGFLGLASTFQMEGRDLTPLILNNHQVNSEIFAGSTFIPNDPNPYFKKTQVVVVRDNQWKLLAKTIFDSDIPQTTLELYDISNDGKETKNMANTRVDILNKLKQKLQNWLKRMDAYPIK